MAPEQVERRLAAILATDMVESSRLIELDEEGTLARHKAHRSEFIDPKIAEHHGRIVKSTGDGLLVEFASAVDAVRCAVELQRAMAEREAEIPEDRRIRYRVGINLGDIIVEEDDILGDGVNVAVRLEGLADPGGICISGTAYDHLKQTVDAGYEFLGERRVKNIEKPVRVYRVLLEPDAAGTVVVNLPRRQKFWQQGTIIAAAAVFAVAVTAVWWQPWVERVDPASIERMSFTLPDKPSVAVMPFVNLSDDEKYARLAGGITEDLIIDLSRYRDLFVIAGHSTFAYQGKSVDVREVAQDLGVRYVLEGSIQATADRVRITAQLIDSITGQHVWADRYDRPARNTFAVQDEVTQTVAAALGGHRGAVPNAIREVAKRKPPSNMQAYDLYLLGIESKHKYTAADNREAQRLFRRAIKLDPGLARAYVGLAWTYLNEAYLGWTSSPGESLANFFDSARKAVELDATDAEAHSALGVAYLTAKSNPERAVTEFDRALSLNPNHADVLAQAGFNLPYVGKAQEALSLVQRAMRLNPHYPDWYNYALGMAAYYAGDFDRSAAAMRRAHAQTIESRLYAATSYAQLGEQEKAAQQIEELLLLDPEFTAKKWLEVTPHYDDDAEAHFLDGARKAKLPGTSASQ